LHLPDGRLAGAHCLGCGIFKLVFLASEYGITGKIFNGSVKILDGFAALVEYFSYHVVYIRGGMALGLAVRDLQQLQDQRPEKRDYRCE